MTLRGHRLNGSLEPPSLWVRDAPTPGAAPGERPQGTLPKGLSRPEPHHSWLPSRNIPSPRPSGKLGEQWGRGCVHSSGSQATSHMGATVPLPGRAQCASFFSSRLALSWYHWRVAAAVSDLSERRSRCRWERQVALQDVRGQPQPPLLSEPRAVFAV